MSAPKSAKKPAKPHPDFPLFPHACGQWAKKVRGRLYYFGRWDEHHAALKQWITVRDELLAGVTPVVWDASVVTVADAINLAIAAKEKAWAAGEISEKSFADYLHAGKLIVKSIDRNKPVTALRPHDFAELREYLADGRSVVTLRNLVRRIKVLFNWAIKNQHVEGVTHGDQLWGTEFAQPSAAALRRAKEAQGPRFIPADRIRRLIDNAPPQIKAMVWLGINCAYGATDCATLQRHHIADGWATLERGKTGKTRRSKLWPETIASIDAVASDEDDMLFRTKYGNQWTASGIGSEFAKLRDDGETLTHYWLRHTFLTVAEETKDFEAVRAIMGHVDASIAGVYRETPEM